MYHTRSRSSRDWFHLFFFPGVFFCSLCLADIDTLVPGMVSGVWLGWQVVLLLVRVVVVVVVVVVGWVNQIASGRG